MELPWPFGTTTIIAGFEIPPSLTRKDLNNPQKLYAAAAAAPGDISLRILYASALANQGQPREAIMEYREALRLIAAQSDRRDFRRIQQEAFVHLFLGDSLNRIGGRDEARAEWEAAIRLDPAGAGKAAKALRDGQH